MQPAMNMFRILYQELHDRAVSVACRGSSSSSENSALSDAQLIQLVVEKQEGFVSTTCVCICVCVFQIDYMGLSPLLTPYPPSPFFHCSSINYMCSKIGS